MKKGLVITLVLALMCSTAVRAGELTVGEGTSSNNYIPLNLAYSDEAGTRDQVLYTADLLTAMSGNTITGITFYSGKSSLDYGTPQFTLRMAEVAETELSGFLSPVFTEVYSGTVELKDQKFSIKFATPFEYTGGNLLFESEVTTKGSYDFASFVGTFVTKAAYSNHNGSYAGVAHFLPKTTFAYEAGGSSSCAKPTDLTTGSVGAHEATFNWNSTGNVQYTCVVKGVAVDWTGVEVQSAASATIENLQPETEYEFYVRAYCSESEQSGAAKVAFTTEKFCFEPVNLTVLNIESQSATISWENSGHGETGYEYVCVAKGASPDWSKATKLDLVYTAELTGLSPVTEYDVYVRSICAGDENSGSEQVSFKTVCGLIALPFAEDFDAVAGNSLPTCWSKISSSATYPCKPSYGSKALAFNMGGGASQIAILPQFEGELAKLTIELEYTMNVYDYVYNGTLEVGYMTDPSDAATFTAVETLEKSSIYATVKVDFAGAPTEAEHIALRATALSGDGMMMYVDNIKVTKAAACPQPINLSVGSLTYQGATCTWEQGETEDLYEWSCVEHGAAVSSWNALDPEIREVSISGLTPGVEYDFVVRSVCTGHVTGDEVRASFTPVCQTPTEVKVSGITDSYAELSWTDAVGTSWTVEVEHEGNKIYFNQYAEDGTSVNLTLLEPDADYSVRVARLTPCESDFTAAISFHTLCASLTESDLPLSEDFESVPVNTLPECWNSVTSGMYPTVVEGSGAYGADEWTSGRFVSFYGDGEEMLILPKFDKAVKDLVLLLRYKTNNCTLEAGYLESLETSFVKVADLEGSNYTSATDPTEVKFDGIAFEGTGYVALRYTASSMYSSASVDNIVLQAKAEGPTIVEQTEATSETVKRIENGQLIIVRDGIRYNAIGTIIK